MIVLIHILKDFAIALNVLVMLRCVISFLPTYNSGFVDGIYNLTEPILKPIRDVLSQISFLRDLPLDLSPLVVFVILDVIINL